MAIEAAEELQTQLPLLSKEESLQQNLSLDFELADLHSQLNGLKAEAKELQGRIKVKEQEKAQVLTRLRSSDQVVYVANASDTDMEEPEEGSAITDDELAAYDDPEEKDDDQVEGEQKEGKGIEPPALEPEHQEEVAKHLEKCLNDDDACEENEDVA